MANIYWRGEKASRKEVRDALMKDLVNETENRYTVAFASDGSGHHVVAYAERDPNSSDTPFKNTLPSKYMGWRLLKIHVPNGYIDVFFEEDGSKKITKSYDE